METANNFKHGVPGGIPASYHSRFESMVEQGMTTPGDVNNIEFIKQLKSLAKEKRPEYCYLLGLFLDYFFSREVLPSRKDGERWMMVAARLGHQEAINWCEARACEYLFSQNYVRAAPIVRVLAFIGVPQMQCFLSMMYISGRGLKASPSKAKYWGDKANRQGFDFEQWLDEKWRNAN